MTQELDENRAQTIRMFASGLSTQISTSMTYLHTTITWAITVFVGVVGAIVISDSFPNGNLQLLLTVLFLVLAHLFIRTAKAYLNVMRFTALEKLLLQNLERGDYETCSRAIDTYYIRWVSPLPAWTVLWKTLLELGFAYMYAVIMGLFIYASISNPTRIIWLMAGAHCVVGFELYFGLLRSSYLRKVEPFPIAVEQR
jgi:predicted branched-subunit amino acid permease